MAWHTPLFLCIFLAAFVVQTLLWKNITIVDDFLWIRRTEKLIADIKQDNINAYDSAYSGHPGNSLVSMAALAQAIGSPPEQSVQGSLALIIAITIAGVVSAGMLLNRTHLWPIAGGIMILLNPLWSQSSPTNAIMAPLTVLAWILVLALSLLPHHPKKTLVSFILGVSVGISLVTRMVDTMIILPFLFFIIFKKTGAQTLGFIIAVATITAFLADPLLLFDPIRHLDFIFFRSSLNITGAIVANPISFSSLLLYAPVALASFMLACASLFTPNVRNQTKLPRDYLASLISLTVVFTVIFFNVRAQSTRYFFPIIFTWEFFAPLLVAEYASHTIPRILSYRLITHTMRQWIRYSAMIVLVVNQIILFFISVVL